MHWIITIFLFDFFYTFTLCAELNENTNKEAYVPVITADDYAKDSDEEGDESDGERTPRIDDEMDPSELRSSESEEEEETASEDNFQAPKLNEESLEHSNYLEDNFRFIKREKKGSFRLSDRIRGIVDYYWLKENNSLVIEFLPCVGEKINTQTLKFCLFDDGHFIIFGQQSHRSFGEKDPRVIKRTNNKYIIELIETLKTVK